MRDTFSQIHIQIVFAVKRRQNLILPLLGTGIVQIHHRNHTKKRSKNVGDKWHA